MSRVDSSFDMGWEKVVLTRTNKLLDGIFLGALSKNSEVNEHADSVKKRIRLLTIIDIRAQRGQSRGGYQACTNVHQNNVCREYTDYIQTGDASIIDASTREKRDRARGQKRLNRGRSEDITIKEAIEKWGFPFVARFFEKKPGGKMKYFHAAVVLGPGEPGNYITFTKDGLRPGVLWQYTDVSEKADLVTFEPILS